MNAIASGPYGATGLFLGTKPQEAVDRLAELVNGWASQRTSGRQLFLAGPDALRFMVKTLRAKFADYLRIEESFN